jgi:adenylate cyclase
MKLLTTLRRRRRRFYKSLWLGVGVSVLLSTLSYLGHLEIVESKALDFLMLVRGEQRSAEIVLVQIDDDAFEKLGERQPLPRSYLASLIDIVARGGAKVIGLDIELKVSTDPAADDRLLSAFETAGENGLSKVVPVFFMRPLKEDDQGMLFRRSPFFDARLDGIAGFANAPVDVDGFIRKVPITLRGSDGRALPSLALAVVARYAGYDPAKLDAALNSGAEITLNLPEWNRLDAKPRSENSALTFTAGENWRINFAGGRGSFAFLPSGPLAQLAQAQVPLAADNPFRGKIVLIGATFQESRDFYPTPHGLLSGLEIHANIIHTILTRSRIEPARQLLALGLLLVFTLISSLLITLFSPTLVTILSVAAIPLILIPMSYLAFAYLGLWVDFVTPLVAIRWGALAAEYLEGRHVKKSLGQYVGLEVAKQIVEQDEQLAGKKQVVTVFFTDVRNFTTMCEGLAPEEIVGRMNEMFAMMGKIIERQGGMIFDFIGDAILAVFGAPKDNPDHARAAAKSAVEVIAGLDELNGRWVENQLAPLRIGIGLHTGEVMMGIVGTGERKKFDVTGDTVNTGSRVEGLNKELGTTILATRETVARLNGEFNLRNCGEVAVKGREKPVEVFEILTAAEHAFSQTVLGK